MASVSCSINAILTPRGPTSPASGGPPRRSVAVRAVPTVNTGIRKDEEIVEDSVSASQLEKAVTSYCRCWKSGEFPICDNSHMKHNEATGDNVGPVTLKKNK